MIWGTLFWQGIFISRLMVAITYCAVANCLDCLAAGFLWFLTGNQYDALLGSSLLFFAGAGISKGLLLLFSFYLYRMARYTQKRRRNRIDWFLLMLPALGLLLFSLFFVEYIRDYGSVNEQLALTFAFFSAVTILYFVQKFESENAKQNAEMYKKQQQELIRQNQEQRAILHDAANFSLTIGSLLEHGCQEQALALVKQLSDRYRTTSKRINTDNPTVDAILNDQCSKAAAQGIQLHVEMCSLKNLAMKEIDIVVVFSNLLDNARTACLDCTETRRISIQAVPSGTDGVRLTVRNTCAPKPPQPVSHLITARVDAHGYGQKNIQRVLKQYGCCCDFEQDGDWYRAITILPCPCDLKDDSILCS